MISQRKFPKVSAEQITQAVARDVFDWKTHIVVPNVSWGLVSWEMDIAVLTGSNWLHEVEVKLSLSDLKNDAGKAKWRSKEFSDMVRSYYVALPAVKYCDFSPFIRDGAGVILMHNGTCSIRQDAKINKGARRLTADERSQLLRLGYMRYWSRNDAASQLLEILHERTDFIAASTSTGSHGAPEPVEDLFDDVEGDEYHRERKPRTEPPKPDEDLFA